MIDSGLTAWLYKQIYCRLIGSVLPAHWFGPRPPEQLLKAEGNIHLEIVSHCWNYAHLCVYQLSSLVKYPPKNLTLTYTMYYSEEDQGTVKLVNKFAAMQIEGIKWNFQQMPTNELFRRAIGRNKASLATEADWILLGDCDLIFHHGCLDSIGTELAKVNCRLAYPASEQVTELLPADHALVNLPQDQPELVDIDPSMFHSIEVTKAKGTFQIVHGDVARHCGYCRDLRFYQRPTNRWRKTFEDTAFRQVIDDEGIALPITGLHRIRHQEKGRYAKNSKISQFRTSLRHIEDKKPKQGI